MIVYNETIKIDLDIHDLWLRWMREEHIPKVMATGCFLNYKLYRIMVEDETDGISYAFQYFANGMSNYFDYQKNHAAKLQREGLDMFPGKYQAFSTILKEL